MAPRKKSGSRKSVKKSGSRKTANKWITFQKSHRAAVTKALGKDVHPQRVMKALKLMYSDGTTQAAAVAAARKFAPVKRGSAKKSGSRRVSRKSAGSRKSPSKKSGSRKSAAKKSGSRKVGRPAKESAGSRKSVAKRGSRAKCRKSDDCKGNLVCGEKHRCRAPRSPGRPRKVGRPRKSSRK